MSADSETGEHFDHNSAPQPSPKINISFHLNGNIKEFNVVMPNSSSQVENDHSKDDPQNHLSRNRVDSGYEEEESLLSRGNIPEIAEDTVNPTAKDDILDANAMQNIVPSSYKPIAQISGSSGLDVATETMLASQKHNKLPEIDDRVLEEEKSIKKKKESESE